MNTNLSSGKNFLARILFPFKAYLVVVVPFYFVFRIFCPEPSHPTGATDGTGFILFDGFIASGLILLIGAIAQFLAGSRRVAAQTLLFAAAPLLVWLALLLMIHG